MIPLQTTVVNLLQIVLLVLVIFSVNINLLVNFNASQLFLFELVNYCGKFTTLHSNYYTLKFSSNI